MLIPPTENYLFGNCRTLRVAKVEGHCLSSYVT
jgi:hypothetical protein